MRNVRSTVVVLWLLHGATAWAQGDRPAIIPPLDIPLLPAGNFMELRDGHFHSGLDLKTNGGEGLPVRAVKDGFVARIRVSPWGYGRAIYLQHPDGTTTVYGHLSRFAPAVAETALKAQYDGKDFTIDHYPQPGALTVKQGDVIAWSGNTGGSSAPHLHFEMRRTADQHAVDPEAHGIEINDQIPPEILGVRLYPLDSGSLAGPYPGRAVGFAASLRDGVYALDSEAVVAGIGTIGLAIHTIDRYNGSTNKCGVRHIALFVDDVPAFSVDLSDIDFDVNRYCNAHMDYGLYKDQDMHYHRLYRLPNDRLWIYGSEAMQGRIQLAPGQMRSVRITVTDANGNGSTVAFTMRGATAREAGTWPMVRPEGTHMRYDAESRFSRDGVQLVLPPLTLYEDLDLRYEMRPPPARSYSALHVLGDRLTPMQLNAQLSIRTDSLPAALRPKALIVRYDGPANITPQGGRWENGWVKASIRGFGAYTVMVDLIAPKITPLDIREDMKGRDGFSFKIADDLSGIESWTATLDGKWILMDFDPKSKTLSHRFDAYSEGPGKRTLVLSVNDERGNAAIYTSAFSR